MVHLFLQRTHMILYSLLHTGCSEADTQLIKGLCPFSLSLIEMQTLHIFPFNLKYKFLDVGNWYLNIRH